MENKAVSTGTPMKKIIVVVKACYIYMLLQPLINRGCKREVQCTFNKVTIPNIRTKLQATTFLMN